MELPCLSFEALTPEIEGDRVLNVARVVNNEGTFILSYYAPRVPRKNADWYDFQLKLDKIG